MWNVRYGTGLISVVHKIFASINSIFILAGDWPLGYHSMGFRQIPNIS